jgi:hypothetical protein
MSQDEIVNLTDRELHNLCSTCGANIRKLQKEFAAYLHEVARRGLYKRYGFYSLYEYAAKLAGMSHPVVDEIMAVHKKLEDKPVLKDLMAEQGWTKLKIVATSATPENQGFWAEKVRQMSKSALETYVRELRKQGDTGVDHQTGLFTDSADITGVNPGICTQADTSQKEAITFRLDSETETKLRIFKHRYEKQTGEPQDWNSIMNKLLKIAEEHGQCGKRGGCAGTAGKPKQQPLKEAVKNALPAVSKRHIPAVVKHYLVRKYEGKCAYPDCKKPSEILHHTRRFALNPSHDPDFIAPLCKAHESIAHQGLIKNEEGAPEKWAVSLAATTNNAKSRIDAKVNGFRKPDG